MQTGGRDDWRPAANREALEARAELLQTIRRFFSERGVLEVETPLLSEAGNPDPNIESMRVEGAQPDKAAGYLHTSPEFPMKRLLAAGSGAIYQLCRVFRAGERSRWHNPEFTMLEWYRPGFDLAAMMDETVGLVRECLAGQVELGATVTLTWRDALVEYAGLDPEAASDEDIRARGDEAKLSAEGLDRDQWLDLMFSRIVAPAFAVDRPVLVTGFPVSQAALARTDDHARRFELFVGALELANGYEELTDATENRRRFEAWNETRRDRGLPAVVLDDRFLEAVDAGLPQSCGVALGVDRLLMLKTGATHIDEVLAFPWSRA